MKASLAILWRLELLRIIVFNWPTGSIHSMQNVSRITSKI